MSEPIPDVRRPGSVPARLGGELASASVSTGFCRVTVVTTRTRLDVALPELVPVAELLAELARMTGLDAPAPELFRLGEPPLDRGRSLAAAGVRDGEVLYLVPAEALPPPARSEDLVLDVADAAGRRGGAFSARAGAVGLTALAGVLAVLPLVAALPRPPGRTTAVLLAVLALVLEAPGLPPVRRLARPLAGGAGLAGAVAAVPCWLAAAAVLARAERWGTGGLLVALAVALAVAALATVLVARRLPRLAGPVLLAAAGAAAASGVAVGTGWDPTPTAAATGVLALALLAFVPGFGLRVTGLTGELRADDRRGRPPGSTALLRRRQRIRSAQGLVATLLTGLAALLAGCVAELALFGGAAALVLAGLLGLLSLGRARRYLSTAHVVPLLLPPAVALVCLQARLLLAHGTAAPWLVAVPLATAALALLVRPLTARTWSPAASLAVDRLEVLAAVAVVAVAAGAMGLYHEVHAWAVDRRH